MQRNIYGSYGTTRGYIVDFWTMMSDNIYMVTILGEKEMDLASLSVNKIMELVNNNVSTLHFVDKKAFIVVDGQKAEITPWVIDRVLMADDPDPCDLRPLETY
tara:strand:+ start:1166 stop:1474 length:309 start_codon:yes stop_codon:yes gene_type:complete